MKALTTAITRTILKSPSKKLKPGGLRRAANPGSSHRERIITIRLGFIFPECRRAAEQVSLPTARSLRSLRGS